VTGEQERSRFSFFEVAYMSDEQIQRMEAILNEGGLLRLPERVTDAELAQLQAGYPAAVIRRDPAIPHNSMVVVRRRVAIARGLLAPEEERS
jgi:hypothetical protein